MPGQAAADKSTLKQKYDQTQSAYMTQNIHNIQSKSEGEVCETAVYSLQVVLSLFDFLLSLPPIIPLFSVKCYNEGKIESGPKLLFATTKSKQTEKLSDVIYLSVCLSFFLSS